MFGGSKDRHPTNVGLIAPVIILAIIAANLISGRVVWPPERHTWVLYATYTDAWRFWGTVVVKLGVAIAAFGWGWLANFERLESHAVPVTIGGLTIIAVGFVAVSIGFFV